MGQTVASSPKDKSQAPCQPLSKGDLDALDVFCKDFDFEEVELDEWAQLHSVLHLKIELRLSSSEFIPGSCHRVKFARTILQMDPAGKEIRTIEKVELEIKLPEKVEEGMVLTLAGHGDRAHEESGDLLVHIKQR